MALQAHTPRQGFTAWPASTMKGLQMVSLSTINEEVDNEYGPFVVDDVPGGDVTLRNLIRLTDNELDQATKLNARIVEAQKARDLKEALACARGLLELVGVGDGGKRLLDALGNDSAKVMYVLQLWSEATQAGEVLGSGNSSETTATP